MQHTEQQSDKELAWAKALALLARREYSAFEISARLSQKGFDEAISEAVIAGLQEAGYQSDARFCESFLRSKFARGDGPLKIKQALREKGIEAGLADDCLSAYDEEWSALAREVHDRRFGPWEGGDFKERARRMRFLAGRGFSREQIESAFSMEGFDGV